MIDLFRIALAALAMIVGIGPAAAKPVSPIDAFYTVRPEDLTGAPGTLIRQAPIDLLSVYRAKAYRILYVSRNLKGDKIGVSGMMVVSTLPGRGATRPIVAWAHATTGVAHKCAPSRRSDPLAIPGIKDMIARGYTVVATDYPGLGTPGPVPYLIGLGEAQSVLDSVKAVRTMPEAQAGDAFVLWGHSQGGHAVLFAASLAKTYAAELKLLGVAAAAPGDQSRRPPACRCQHDRRPHPGGHDAVVLVAQFRLPSRWPPHRRHARSDGAYRQVLH